MTITASNTLTLLDIAKMNGADAIAGLIDETIRSTPELTGVTLDGVRLPFVGASRPIKGLQYKTLVRTALPVVGFRGANQGTPVSKSTWANRVYETFIFNPPIEMDVRVAESDEDGPAACIAKEASGIWEASVQTVCKQFYYGNAASTWAPLNDSLGFPGLMQVYDTVNMQVDATGTTQGVAASGTISTSVWGVRYGVKDVQWIFGNGGEMRLTDVIEYPKQDSSGNPYMAYHQEIVARIGLQMGRSWTVGRIKNVTSDAGKGLDDALMGRLLTKFRAGFAPHVFFMTKEAREQLRASRTAVNPTGLPAPIPQEFEGIPILATESISNTELCG
jgi:hypothetical protein